MNLDLPTNLTFESAAALGIVLVIGTVCLIVFIIIIRAFFNPKKTKIGNILSIESGTVGNYGITKKDIADCAQYVKKISIEAGINKSLLFEMSTEQRDIIKKKLETLKNSFAAQYEVLLKNKNDYLVTSFYNFLTRYFEVILLNMFFLIFEDTARMEEKFGEEDFLDLVKKHINLGIIEWNRCVDNYYIAKLHVIDNDTIKKFLTQPLKYQKNELLESYRTTIFNLLLGIKNSKEKAMSIAQAIENKVDEEIKLKLDSIKLKD
jgi:hypothetical protein